MVGEVGNILYVYDAFELSVISNSRLKHEYQFEKKLTSTLWTTKHMQSKNYYCKTHHRVKTITAKHITKWKTHHRVKNTSQSENWYCNTHHRVKSDIAKHTVCIFLGTGSEYPGYWLNY